MHDFGMQITKTQFADLFDARLELIKYSVAQASIRVRKIDQIDPLKDRRRLKSSHLVSSNVILFTFYSYSLLICRKKMLRCYLDIIKNQRYY